MKFNFFVLFFFFLIISCDKQASNSSKKVVMEKIEENAELRHVVLFKFKESSSSVDIETLEIAFKELCSKISEIKDFEWGTNNSPENINKGFTHCFLLTFHSEKDRDNYLPHPEHVKFGNLLKPHLEDVLVLDYWVN